MSSQRLSAELFFAICNHLFDDPATLCAASLSFSHFRAPAQETLFRAYSLTFNDDLRRDQSRLPRLQELVDPEAKTVPRLVCCIRSLTINCDAMRSKKKRDRWLWTNAGLITKFFESLPHEKIHTLAISGTHELLLASLPDESESKSESEPESSPTGDSTLTYTTSELAQLHQGLRESMGKILGGRNLRTVWIGRRQSVSILRLCNTLSVKHVFLTGRLSPLTLTTTPEDTAKAEDLSNKLSLDSLTCLLDPWNRLNPGWREQNHDLRGYVGGHLPLVHPQSPFRLSVLKKLVLEGGSVGEVSDILKEACNLEWFEFDWPSESSRKSSKRQ
jgi:hypothetical protein